MEPIDGQNNVTQVAAQVSAVPGEQFAPARNRARPRQMLFLMLGIGIAATTLLAIVAVLSGDFGEGMGKAMISIFAMLVYGLLALIGTHRLDRRPSESLAKASVVAAGIGLATAVISIWAGDSVNAVKLALIGFIISFATSHASVLQARRRPGDPGAVRTLVTLTQAFIAIAATMLCALVIAVEDVGAGFGRALFVVVLLDVMLNVLVPIVRRAMPSNSPSPAAFPVNANPEGPSA